MADTSEHIPKLGSALRDTLRAGYHRRDFRADVLAGIIVGIIALPLSMALAIASGVAPQHGLYTAIIAGAVIALFGGSRTQVSGPTAAFVVILVPITAKYGLPGLAVATVGAGVIQIAMGVLRLGRLIQFVPHPVTTGFTAGIAVVIATLQLKDFFGLPLEHLPEHYLPKVMALAGALPDLRWPELLVGAVTLLLLWGWSKWGRVVPAPLVALVVAMALAAVLAAASPDWQVATIRSRFGTEAMPYGIPRAAPLPVLPGAGVEWSWATGQDLMMSALAIAMLGAIESLLSAVVADGMTGQSHDPDVELTAQGIGNVVAPFFGGFAATGALARTAANTRFGARSPVAAIVHAAFVLLSLLLLAPLLGYLPMAALAALLLRVAWTMSEAPHFVHTLRRAPASDIAVLLICFGLTVVFDMVVAVGVGVVLAGMLFIGRIAAASDSRLFTERHQDANVSLPGVAVYEVGGPLFFGAAQRAMAAITSLNRDARIVLIDLRSVPLMDLTGLVALESSVARLRKLDKFVIIAGAQKQPLQVMAKARFHRDHEHVMFIGDFEHALQTAAMLGHLTDEPEPTT